MRLQRSNVTLGVKNRLILPDHVVIMPKDDDLPVFSNVS